MKTRKLTGEAELFTMSENAISINSPRKFYAKVAIVMLVFALMVPMGPV